MTFTSIESGQGFLVILVALALGGMLKGATGAGAPVVAVPVIALFHDVPTAVVVMILPNLLSNVVQGWTCRAHVLNGRFAWVYGAAGFVGASIGAVLLASVRPDLLILMTAGVVFLYVGFRLTRPDWTLSRSKADRYVAPVGLLAGVLQGATGVSAPVSITFLNAMRLDRLTFMATISIFFVGMSLSQIPVLIWVELLTWQSATLSLSALVPILLAMPAGAWLARRLSAQVFDRVILVLLSVIAVKMVVDAVGGGQL